MSIDVSCWKVELLCWSWFLGYHAFHVCYIVCICVVILLVGACGLKRFNKLILSYLILSICVTQPQWVNETHHTCSHYTKGSDDGLFCLIKLMNGIIYLLYVPAYCIRGFSELYILKDVLGSPSVFSNHEMLFLINLVIDIWLFTLIM